MNIQLYRTELITKYMEHNSMSKAAFARECNINYGSLDKIMTGKANIRLNTVLKVTRILDITIGKFIIR